MTRRASLCCLVVLALSGCGERDAAAPGPAPVPAPAAQQAPADDGAAEAVPPGFDDEARGAPVAARQPDAPVLVDVRTGEHEGFDRLVFEFDADALPQWRAEWVDIPITDCGAGHVVAVAGTAWLQVRFSGAAAHTPEGKPTSGPRQRRLRHPVLRDLVRTCDFEGEVAWVAGLSGRRPFRTDTLASPPRLVIDIAH